MCLNVSSESQSGWWINHADQWSRFLPKLYRKLIISRSVGLSNGSKKWVHSHESAYHWPAAKYVYFPTEWTGSIYRLMTETVKKKQISNQGLFGHFVRQTGAMSLARTCLLCWEQHLNSALGLSYFLQHKLKRHFRDSPLLLLNQHTEHSVQTTNQSFSAWSVLAGTPMQSLAHINTADCQFARC